MSTETPFNTITHALGGTSIHNEGDEAAVGEDIVTTADFVPVDSLRIDRTAIVKFKKVGDVSLILTGIVCICLTVSICLICSFL